MTKTFKAILVATIFVSALGGSAVAQTVAEKPAAISAKVGASDADKRAKAADCSKQANAKKLHGMAREKFRAACKQE